jgi:hypothetical protein
MCGRVALRHCEAQSDEAIQCRQRFWIASLALAMTATSSIGVGHFEVIRNSRPETRRNHCFRGRAGVSAAGVVTSLTFRQRKISTAKIG